MSNLIPDLASGFIGGVIAWFGTNYFGRSLRRFWDLRQEARIAILRSDLHQVYKLASEIKALILPKPIFWYLRIRGYDLQGAAQALIALSQSLRRQDGDGTRFCVKAQGYLKLPIDPKNQKIADSYRRLENANPGFYDP